MLTILRMIERAGGWTPELSLRIENAPYMTLVIEILDESGPTGLPVLSVAHSREQDGYRAGHPEMRFEVRSAILDPFYYGNQATGVAQWSRRRGRPPLPPHYPVPPAHWDVMLRRQAFLEVFEQQSSQRD